MKNKKKKKIKITRNVLEDVVFECVKMFVWHRGNHVSNGNVIEVKAFSLAIIRLSQQASTSSTSPSSSPYTMLHIYMRANDHMLCAMLFV